MNALKVLLWVEWKKSSSVVSALAGVLGLGSIVLVFSGMSGTSILNQLMLLGLVYFGSLIVLVLMSLQLGSDFRSDRFHLLLLSPPSALTHLLARLVYPICAAIVFHSILALVTFVVFRPYLEGDLGGVMPSIFLVNFQFVAYCILPSLVLMVLSSLVSASFTRSSNGRRGALFVFAVATLSWASSISDLTEKYAGSILPPSTIHVRQLNVNIWYDQVLGVDTGFRWSSVSSATNAGGISTTVLSSSQPRTSISDAGHPEPGITISADENNPRSSSAGESISGANASLGANGLASTNGSTNKLKPQPQASSAGNLPLEVKNKGMLTPVTWDGKLSWDRLLIVLMVCGVVVYLSARIWEEVEV